MRRRRRSGALAGQKRFLPLAERGAAGQPTGTGALHARFPPGPPQGARRPPGSARLAGHDDVYILGPPTDCLAAYATFIAHAAEVALDVCESRVYSVGADTLVDASAALTAVATVVPAVEGLVVFGTPIGDPAWEQRHLRALLSEHRASLRALAALKNPQVSQHLLAQSQATRVTHLLRTMKPEATAELAVTHDEQLWTAFGH